MTDKMLKIISEYRADIFGFFLGDANGTIHKERIFDKTSCPESILKNLVSAICSFVEETHISNQGTIGLSDSIISFIKIKDITYVLNHNIKNKDKTDELIKLLSDEFENRSRAKFHSDDPKQVFSGASAVFKRTIQDLFEVVIKYQQNQSEKQEQEVITSDLEVVNLSLNQEEKKESSEQNDVSHLEETKLTAITFNILNSLDGIKHLVFIEHEDNKAKMFFENGSIEEKLVKKTISISQKFLNEIVNIMNDEDEENAIQVSTEFQIIFVPLNEKNFMYAITTKVIDPVLMKPVFERIARRITSIVLNYKEEKGSS